MLRTLSFLQKQGLLAVVFVFSSFLVAAQKFPVKWDSFPLNDTIDVQADVILTNGGRVVVSTNGPYTDISRYIFTNSYSIYSLNASGKLIWKTTFESPTRLFLKKMLPIPSGEGDFFTLGTCSIDPNEPYDSKLDYRGWITRRDSAGEIVQNRLIGNADFSTSFWSGVISSDKKNLLVVGQQITSFYEGSNALS